ncbi:MAG: Membrane-bound lytic murein transglycosylase F [Syntrophus sp. SKADARSKE-3]|nr:Membrane-bound lytic murein transglycosylase F [Syntrophus sp. SKADARSKE-3]
MSKITLKRHSLSEPIWVFMLFLLGSFSYLSTACADIYKFVDDNGVINLTNIPSNANAKYELVYKEKRIIFNIKPKDVLKYDHLISRAAEKYNVDAALIKAVIKTESNFNHRAVSPKGAQGLMQLMPRTASALRVEDSFHPENNIEGGTRYLRYLLNIFDGNLSLALAAYNAGEKTVIKYRNNIPPFRETQNYVQRVLALLNDYRKN